MGEMTCCYPQIKFDSIGQYVIKINIDGLRDFCELPRSRHGPDCFIASPSCTIRKRKRMLTDSLPSFARNFMIPHWFNMALTATFRFLVLKCSPLFLDELRLNQRSKVLVPQCVIPLVTKNNAFR
jgi:hypothetical protein